MVGLRTYRTCAAAVLLLLISVAAADTARSRQQVPVTFHKITVVDESTSRGIPCISLTTSDSRRYYTDSAGVVALFDRDLFGTQTFFTIEGYGYLFPANWLGQHGRTVEIVPGGETTLTMQRINIAERLYRVTGSGIYRDSVLLGESVPPTQDETTNPVTGMDSVQSIPYRGKMYWFWGDTSVASNPLGNFRTTGATSELPANGGLDPDVGVSLTFFRSGGSVRPMFEDKHKPIWVGGLRVLGAQDGRERLFTNYVKVDNSMRRLEAGLAEFDDNAGGFKITYVYPENANCEPGGHAFRLEENGTDWIYYADPFPCMRHAAAYESLTDIKSLEAFTCVKEDTRYTGKDDELDRDPQGKLRWGWKKYATPADASVMKKMIQNGHLGAEDAWFSVRDTDTTATVQPHSGSVYYNEFRKRWISIRSEVMSNASLLGEVWYFEGDTPLGPWVFGQKIVTHRLGQDKINQVNWGSHKAETYSFYNPMQHPEFDKEGGQIIYFEGTYTAGFTGNVVFTPGYNYNQIMYKLDLDDERLRVPVPIYKVGSNRARYSSKRDISAGDMNVHLAFFAPDRQRPGTVPIFANGVGDLTRLSLSAAQGHPSVPAFYAVPPDQKPAKESPLTPLYEFRKADGTYEYAASESPAQPGMSRSEAPLCFVWPNVLQIDPSAIHHANEHTPGSGP
ncbi:MAG: hypothetical protein ACR2IE_17125 [Candidatus Sumerlaeaceae bacterium]